MMELMGRMSCLSVGLGAAMLVAGCGGDGDPLGDIDGAREWANRSSAVGVWSRVHDIVGAGDARDPFPDPDCPVIADDGTTVTVTGGCTASDGQMWVGSATIVRMGMDDEDITIEGFGHSDDPGFIATLSGTVAIRALFDGGYSFDLDLVNDATFEGVTTITYDGTVDGYYAMPTTWNGSGTFDLEGERVTASTVDELWDPNVCRGAPASGTTTMTSALHTVVITYDGAIDCDEDKNAGWTLDGADMGPIDGISCSASGPGARPSLALLALLGAAFVLRRRRRARRTS